MGLNPKAFASKPKGSSFSPSGTNLEARAVGSAGYTGHAAGGAAAKDIGAAMALVKQHQLKPSTKTAATNAPGPRKV